MATTIVTTPLGTFSSPKFTLSLPRYSFDPLFKVNVDLIGANLTVVNGNGPGQGACGYPEFAQNSGIRYWEVTWSGLTNNALAGGPGLCSIPAIDNYAGLAANGLGGLHIRPDGTVVWQDVLGQFRTFNTGMMQQQEGDTLGFLLDMTLSHGDGAFDVTIFSIRQVATSGVFQLPPDLVIPCVVFDNDGALNADGITATFSLDRDSYLGPKTFPDFGWDNVSWGWPNTA